MNERDLFFALLAGWLASPNGLAIRKAVADSADLLPDSDDELAKELRARDVEIVYDTPATTNTRAVLAETIQPYISPGNYYDRDPQNSSSVFQPSSGLLQQALEELRRRVESAEQE